jgi:hypothetical protein
MKTIRLARNVGGPQQLRIGAALGRLDPVHAVELGGYETLAPSGLAVDTPSRQHAEGR